MKYAFLLGISVSILSTLPMRSFATTESPACATIDLRQETCPQGGPRLRELRDQGDTNYCFAYSMADYYSYFQCKDYSGLSAGLIANLMVSIARPRPGDDFHVLDSGMAVPDAQPLLEASRGICLESEYSSNRQEIIDPDSLQRFYADVWQRRNSDVFRCHRQAVPHVQWTTTTVRNNMASAIHAELNQRRPVLLNIDGEVVMNAHMQPNPDPGGHVVMIVGRKLVGGQCKLLVRDPTPVYGDVPWTVDNGYVWIPESALLSQTGMVMTGRQRAN